MVDPMTDRIVDGTQVAARALVHLPRLVDHQSLSALRPMRVVPLGGPGDRLVIRGHINPKAALCSDDPR
jgi:hypothetical protein